MSSYEVAQLEERRVVHKAAWRIVPFLTVCFLVAFLDRINIGFASLQMNSALHISPDMFGLAGGLFFVSYFVCEVPSNLLLERFGARKWLARIMISWGLIAAGTAFVQGGTSFAVLRVILGAAEAGFYPGVIVYLVMWFPRKYRAQMFGWFSTSIPLSGVIGSPVSAALLSMPHALGLAPWQWLYICEGLPAVLLGFACYFVLPDRPESARWLSTSECAVLRAALDNEFQVKDTVKARSVLTLIFSAPVLWLALILSGTTAVSAAYAVWMPQIIKSYHWSIQATGWLNALLFLIGTIVMIVFGWLSDHKRERRWHSALPLFVSAIATFAFFEVDQFSELYVLFAVAVAGIYACKGAAWAFVTEALPQQGRAAAIAQVNALSNLVGFLTITVVGQIFHASHNFSLALLPLGVLSAISALVVLGWRYTPYAKAAG